MVSFAGGGLICRSSEGGRRSLDVYLHVDSNRHRGKGDVVSGPVEVTEPELWEDKGNLRVDQ